LLKKVRIAVFGHVTLLVARALRVQRAGPSLSPTLGSLKVPVWPLKVALLRLCHCETPTWRPLS